MLLLLLLKRVHRLRAWPVRCVDRLHSVVQRHVSHVQVHLVQFVKLLLLLLVPSVGQFQRLAIQLILLVLLLLQVLLLLRLLHLLLLLQLLKLLLLELLLLDLLLLQLLLLQLL